MKWHPGTRYLTPLELAEWYEAINAVYGSRPRRHKLTSPAIPTQVSKPISMKLNGAQFDCLRIPLGLHR